jgi:hypothetical protein
MSDVITVTTALSGNSWTVTATVTTPGVLPAEIFAYENTGTAALGNYVGVCSFDELTRFQIWNSQALPLFGNKFVRTSQAKITVPISVDTSAVVANLISTAKMLKAEITAKSDTSQAYSI